MNKNSHRRSKFRIWILFVVLIFGTIFFHKPLILLGCKAGIHRLLPDRVGRTVSYERIQWEENILVVSGLHVQDTQAEFTIDRIEIQPLFHSLCFEPKITLVHPQIAFTADDGQSESAGALMARSRFFAPRWEIKNGVLTLSRSSRFYFMMSAGEEKDALGEIVFSSDPDPMVPPMFSLDLHLVDKNLQMGFHLQESDLARLVPLSGLLFQKIPRDWERASGEVELEGLLSLDSSLSLKELHFRGEGKEIALSNAALGLDLHCDEFSGTFSWPAKVLSASVVLKNGNFVASAPLVHEAIEISKLEGNLCMGPDKDPELELKGKIQGLSFTCLGKGGIHPDKTFWSEIELHSASSQSHEMQATVSLCSYPDKDLSLHLQVDDADAIHLDLMRALCQIPGKCLEGTASFGATFFSTQGHWHQATVENCQLEKMKWSLPEMNATLSAKQIAAETTFSNNNAWALEDLHWQMENGEYSSPKLRLGSIAMDLAIEGKTVQPSQIKTEWEGLQTEIEILGPSGDHFADVRVHGDAKEAIAMLFSKKVDSIPLNLQFAADMEKDLLTLHAQGTFAEEPIEGTAAFSGKWPTFAFKEATWNAEHLTEKSYGKIVPMLVPGIAIAGNLKCEGNLKPSGAEISIGGDDILLQHPLAQLYLSKTDGIHFAYDREKDLWLGAIPLEQGKLKYREADLLFDNLEGLLEIDGNHLSSSGFYAEVEGLAVRGDMDLVLENAQDGQLSLTTSQVAGSVPHLFSVLRRFSFFPKREMPIDGSFYCEKEGFALRAVLGGNTEPEINFKGHFQGLQFPINAATSLTEGNCDLAFNSKDNCLRIEKGEGKWQLIDGTPLSVSLKRLTADKKNIDFALKVSEGRKEWAHIEAKVVETPSLQWEIAFQNPATSFDGTPLNIQRCVLDPKLELSSYKMSPILKCRDLPAWASLLKNAGFLSQTFSLQSLVDLQCEGSMQTEVFSENASKGFSIHAQSRDFCVRGKPLPGFQFKATRRGEIWHIEQLESTDLSLKGKIEDTGTELACREFQGKWQGIEWKGNGKVKQEQMTFSCQLESVKGDLTACGLPWNGTFAASAALSGDFSDPKDPLKLSGEANVSADVLAPVRFTAKNKKAVRFTYNNANGLICQGVDLQLKDKQTGETLADLKAEKLAGLNVEKFQFSLARGMIERCVEAKVLHASLKDLKWEDRLEGEGDLQMAPKVVFQAAMKPGSYGIGNYDLPFEQLQVRYEKEVIDVRGKSKINEQPLWAVLQTNIAKDPFGAIKFLDNPKTEGLKCSFSTQNGSLVWDSVQGSCYGLQCQLAKSSKRKVPFASVLSGSIMLNGNSLSPLLPKEIGEAADNFQFGDGYEWQGDLVIFQEAKKGFQLSGALSGNTFEILGCRFQRLQGNLEASPVRVAITDLKIEDPSGAIGIKKITLDKQTEWDLYIPQIVIRNLQPSLMQKIDGDMKTVKPFTIKNGILSEIRGKLGDKSTLEGAGKLVFTNQFKKESSLFDMPIEFIKNIGLDPGLLTPVQGELELELRGDKFYLLSLAKAISEGGRTEFYLAPRGKEPSYIDLSGKMHIDLKMHQDVMLKITEAFTLTIRGTLEKPRYGLQH